MSNKSVFNKNEELFNSIAGFIREFVDEETNTKLEYIDGYRNENYRKDKMIPGPHTALKQVYDEETGYTNIVMDKAFDIAYAGYDDWDYDCYRRDMFDKTRDVLRIMPINKMHNGHVHSYKDDHNMWREWQKTKDKLVDVHEEFLQEIGYYDIEKARSNTPSYLSLIRDDMMGDIIEEIKEERRNSKNYIERTFRVPFMNMIMSESEFCDCATKEDPSGCAYFAYGKVIAGMKITKPIIAQQLLDAAKSKKSSTMTACDDDMFFDDLFDEDELSDELDMLDDESSSYQDMQDKDIWYIDHPMYLTPYWENRGRRELDASWVENRNVAFSPKMKLFMHHLYRCIEIHNKNAKDIKIKRNMAKIEANRKERADRRAYIDPNPISVSEQNEMIHSYRLSIDPEYRNQYNIAMALDAQREKEEELKRFYDWCSANKMSYQSLHAWGEYHKYKSYLNDRFQRGCIKDITYTSVRDLYRLTKNLHLCLNIFTVTEKEIRQYLEVNGLNWADFTGEAILFEEDIEIADVPQEFVDRCVDRLHYEKFCHLKEINSTSRDLDFIVELFGEKFIINKIVSNKLTCYSAIQHLIGTDEVQLLIKEALDYKNTMGNLTNRPIDEDPIIAGLIKNVIEVAEKIIAIDEKFVIKYTTNRYNEYIHENPEDFIQEQKERQAIKDELGELPDDHEFAHVYNNLTPEQIALADSCEEDNEFKLIEKRDMEEFKKEKFKEYQELKRKESKPTKPDPFCDDDDILDELDDENEDEDILLSDINPDYKQPTTQDMEQQYSFIKDMKKDVDTQAMDKFLDNQPKDIGMSQSITSEQEVHFNNEYVGDEFLDNQPKDLSTNEKDTSISLDNQPRDIDTDQDNEKNTHIENIDEFLDNQPKDLSTNDEDEEKGEKYFRDEMDMLFGGETYLYKNDKYRIPQNYRIPTVTKVINYKIRKKKSIDEPKYKCVLNPITLERISKDYLILENWGTYFAKHYSRRIKLGMIDGEIDVKTKYINVLSKIDNIKFSNNSNVYKTLTDYINFSPSLVGIEYNIL